METFRKILAPCLVIFLLFLNCSDSNLFEPDDLIKDDLAWFPLEKGYKADYTYYYSLKTADGTNQLNGNFSIQVIDEYSNVNDKMVFYKIKTEFIIEGGSATLTSEYDVMFNEGFLWYVENAPGFEQLDQGDTTLMMAPPIARGGEMNLKIFELSKLRETRFLITSAGMDTCYYQGNDDIYATTVKSKGIKSLWLLRGIAGTIHYSIHDERFELIEE